ncbi:MAG: hypothetical protein CBC38_05910 [Gammaproteobacteria bacterium TMED78]|nr:MAG: hypothetical protein CBC38_05910 [Gammaproteobacteria bacterium TMED78]|tara:strand:- start:316 stop:1284 length:969 start_codon:yes stop_codon:yes gene_type:complete
MNSLCKKNIRSIIICIFFISLFFSSGCSQNRLNPPQNISVVNAKEYAGSEWVEAYNLLCHESPILSRAGRAANSSLIEPSQLFDNLWVFGRAETVVFILQTSEGYVLIDTFYLGQTESVLLPALQQLDIDPQEIILAIIAHGHADHYGGSRFLQSNYDTPIAASEEDWQLIEDQSDRFATPEYDISISDGEVINIGGIDIHNFLIPGHTPGSLGLIFPVYDGGVEYMAGLFGGTILASDRIDNEGLAIYLDSLERFKEVASSLNVTVELQNHPVIDNLDLKLMNLAIRNPSDPHPFVLENSIYINFLDVISECTKAELFRRK